MRLTSHDSVRYKKIVMSPSVSTQRMTTAPRSASASAIAPKGPRRGAASDGLFGAVAMRRRFERKAADGNMSAAGAHAPLAYVELSRPGKPCRLNKVYARITSGQATERGMQCWQLASNGSLETPFSPRPLAAG